MLPNSAAYTTATYLHVFRVFDITTGLEKTSQPTQVIASANGTGDGSYGGTYMVLDVFSTQ